MALFYQKEKRFPLITYLPVLLLVIVLLFFATFADSFSRSNLDYEKQLLQSALERNITQCYALEGAYPSNLDYLEEQYGLTYNKDHFFIDYQYIGSNLRPDVTIIERD